ncbi:MAG: ATP-binding protein [Verrucomicrobia bacterium]|nr:ATP-binding protein [Verrucomicrobiota bacterium]
MSDELPEKSNLPNQKWILAAALLWFGAFAAPGPAAAAPPYTIDIWDSGKGLPQNSVIAMTQTRDGYLWLGTVDGLVRFDGVRFTGLDQSDASMLNNGAIVSLFEDSHGNLWVGTDTSGIALIKDGHVNFPNLGPGNEAGHLTGVCEDSTGAIWLFTAAGQLYRYRNGAIENEKTFAQRFSRCRQVIQEHSGLVWVGVDWGMFGLDPATTAMQPQFLPFNKLDYLMASRQGGYWRLADGHIQKCHTNHVDRDWSGYPWNNVTVSSACEDRQGNLVVGTVGAGVFWFDTEGKATALSTNEGLSNSYILSLCVDREGSLWVGTDGGGLNRVKRKIFDTVEETRSSVVQSVWEDDGGLWIASNTGVSRRRDGAVQQFAMTANQIVALNIPVRAVFVDRARQVWTGISSLFSGLFRLQEGVFQQVAGPPEVQQGVLAIHQDHRGDLWLGTPGGLVRWNGREWNVFNITNGLSANVVRAIADDSEGNLWIGTVGGGVNRLRDGQFTAYRQSTNGPPSDSISSLCVDRDGVLWVGTTREGLARFHDNKWTRYSKREGLASNSLAYLLDDAEGNLWIGSYTGLMRVPRTQLNQFAEGLTNTINSRLYDVADGLPTTECTFGSQPAACRGRDGRLWFPTIKGLVSIDPRRLQPNTNPPPVVIESVLVDGEEKNTNHLVSGWLQELTVPARNESLDIYYTSLNLAAADAARLKFRLRLEGHETTWTDAGKDRVARYPKLPPGRYLFQVIACNEDGLWNQEGSSLAVIVLPPFWRTWWFLGATAAFLLGAVITMVHYLSTQKLHRQLEHLRQQEALEKERARIARDIHDQVGASLTQVSLLGELVESDKDSPEEVEAHARQISQTARDTTRALDEIVWTVNPSNDSLDGLITYACKYAQEYLAVAGLSYRLDVPTQLPAALISPEVRHNVFLAFKEAITNVVRHAHASSVLLGLRLEADRFTLEIEDNGRGIAGMNEKAAQLRNGLRNMRKRMEDIGGKFAISPAPAGGTVVRLTAPIKDH